MAFFTLLAFARENRLEHTSCVVREKEFQHFEVELMSVCVCVRVWCDGGGGPLYQGHRGEPCSRVFWCSHSVAAVTPLER